MKKKWVKGAVLLTVLVAACQEANGTGQTDDGVSEEVKQLYLASDTNAAEVGGDLVTANTAFAVKMLQALVEKGEGQNLFFSPVSVSIALAMTMNGAAGETLTQMQAALEFEGMTTADINAQFLSLLSSLTHADEDVTITLANSIWIAPGYPIKETFIDDVAHWYLSGVFEADAPESVNRWIAESTGGRITDLIDQFPPNLVMYLVNALYFKGAWTTTFDQASTHTAAFEKSDGSSVEVSMMAMTDRKDYEAYSSPEVTGIRLPYGRGKLAFYAFAPPSNLDEGEVPTIDDFIDTLDGPALASVLAAFDPRELGGVYLPRLKISYETELTEVLKAFGMVQAFEGGFDNLVDPADGDPYISKVLHKAYIEVTEEGTEAAAATAVEMVKRSLPEMFLADKPFMFLIRDDRNGTILFMGRIEDPSAE